jgi:hypothetical protein
MRLSRMYNWQPSGLLRPFRVPRSIHLNVPGSARIVNSLSAQDPRSGTWQGIERTLDAMLVPVKGKFYEFHRRRVVSRPGAELRTRTDIEIGPEISEKEAFRQAGLGMDVYTRWRFDAYKLASRLYAEAPQHEGAHEDVYFPHYHPGKQHPKLDQREGRPRSKHGPGHVFFGERGQGHEDAA